MFVDLFLIAFFGGILFLSREILILIKSDSARAKDLAEFAERRGFRFAVKDAALVRGLGVSSGFGMYAQRHFVRGERESVAFVIYDSLPLLAFDNDPRKIVHTWVAFRVPEAKGELPKKPGWTVESSQGWLRLTDSELDKSVESLDAFLAAAFELARPFLSR